MEAAHDTPAFPVESENPREASIAGRTVVRGDLRDIRLLVALLGCLVPAVASCGSEPDSALAESASLERSAWLGSAETWGLIGLPLSGGAVGYLRARALESPTWAPPEVGELIAAWPGEDAIWVQFTNDGLGRYDYGIGHLLRFEEAPRAKRAVAARERTLIVATPGGELRVVGSAETWRRRVDGELRDLVAAGDGRVVVVSDTESGTRLIVLQPPESDPLGERDLEEGLIDLAISDWANRLYYLPAESPRPVLRELRLPELAEADSFELPEAAASVAATPSGHRLYVAMGSSIQVIDRLRWRPLRVIELPAPISDLRFGENGAVLLARVADSDDVVVVQVGVDTVLGTVPSRWDRYLPVALPGGRLVTARGDSLILYGLPGPVEIAEYAPDEPRVWLPVEWQPPRPRQELARAEDDDRSEREPLPRASAEGATGDELTAPTGYYAVVSAAQGRDGVERLVDWLESVGYPARIDRHSDAMGAIWFRAMVGPYPDRNSAESASRSLNSRYGYKPWILSVETSEAREAEPEDVPRAESPESPDPGVDASGG